MRGSSQTEIGVLHRSLPWGVLNIFLFSFLGVFVYRFVIIYTLTLGWSSSLDSEYRGNIVSLNHNCFPSFLPADKHQLLLKPTLYKEHENKYDWPDMNVVSCHTFVIKSKKLWPNVCKSIGCYWSHYVVYLQPLTPSVLMYPLSLNRSGPSPSQRQLNAVFKKHHCRIKYCNWHAGITVVKFHTAGIWSQSPW